MKPKLVHLHSDPKFVSEVELYSKDLFSNELVFTGIIETLPKEYKSITHPLSTDTKTRFKELVSLCENAEIVVLNNLDGLYSNLALSLPIEKKIIWRFFGNEIYSKESELVHSEESLKSRVSAIKKLSPINQVKHKVWRLLHPEDRFNEAIKQIDFFVGLMDDEYDFLKELGYDLPPFIQFPLTNLYPHNIIFKKKNQIIFGNSRNRANNHLDILKLFKNINLSPELIIKMFFSYGSQSEYTTQVREESKQISQIELIEDFLPTQEFQQVYIKSAALIFNGYRQMAMTNIITAIMTGVKIYLSEKNITYFWLLKIGVKVFSIEKELEEDLKTGNYFLKNDVTLSNMNNLILFANINSKENYNRRILQILDN